MTEAEAKETAGTLALMAELERAIADLYRACAKADADRGEVWERLAGAERNHAVWVRALAKALLERKGEGFRAGRRFGRDTIQTLATQVRKNEMDVRAGSIKGRAMYLMARGLETTLIEDRFYELVTAQDEEHQKLVARIVAETREHQALMHAWAKAAGA